MTHTESMPLRLSAGLSLAMLATGYTRERLALALMEQEESGNLGALTYRVRDALSCDGMDTDLRFVARMEDAMGWPILNLVGFGQPVAPAAPINEGETPDAA